MKENRIIQVCFWTLGVFCMVGSLFKAPFSISMLCLLLAALIFFVASGEFGPTISGL